MAQPLNLTTQCLDNWAEKLPQISDPELTLAMVRFAEVLQRVPKFLLPEGGRPIDDPASVARLYPELHLPFPAVALEYLADGPIGEHEVASRKRISLAWSLDRGAPPLFGELTGVELAPSRGILVQSISYINQVDMWMPIFGMIVVHLEQYPGKMRVQELRPQMAELTRHRMRSTKGSTETYSATAYATVSRIVQQYGPEMAADLVAADSGDEVLAALSFAALSACANVSTEVLPAPAALNKKREARGRPPIFDTRVLMVTSNGYRGRARANAAEAATGITLREHLRRGHVRRLEDKIVLIPNAVVNPGVADAPVPRYALQRERPRGA
ncbi:hypothetical protein [Ramlibacter sp. AN1133]|uniref:hypothetical protein n=1 Tax=Ramlibacter sp. AN1133 TaxID=3133429 RepID=UPI0030BCECA9